MHSSVSNWIPHSVILLSLAHNPINFLHVSLDVHILYKISGLDMISSPQMPQDAYSWDILDIKGGNHYYSPNTNMYLLLTDITPIFSFIVEPFFISNVFLFPAFYLLWMMCHVSSSRSHENFCWLTTVPPASDILVQPPGNCHACFDQFSSVSHEFRVVRSEENHFVFCQHAYSDQCIYLATITTCSDQNGI